MLEGQDAEPKGQSASGDYDSQPVDDSPTQPEPEGQSAEPEGTSDPAPQAEDTFFDPTSLPEELTPAYKQMQAAYTKKMQAIAQDRQKIQAYDAFSQNPVAEIQRLATMYGIQIGQQGQQPTAQQQETEWQPQSWQEVEQRISEAAFERAKSELAKEYAPMVSQVKEMRQADIERQLYEIDPTWQNYEDQMAANLQEHPTLASDPAKLYRLSVPQSVLESRATQKALQRMEDKGRAAQVGSGSKTPKKPGTGVPDGPMSFDDAVNFAKKKLAEEGIVRPGG